MIVTVIILPVLGSASQSPLGLDPYRVLQAITTKACGAWGGSPMELSKLCIVFNGYFFIFSSESDVPSY